MYLIIKLLAYTQLIAVIKGNFVNPFLLWNTKSVTTVSGPLAPQGRIYPGQLIFEDNFDKFNLNAWKHSLTLSGKGVSINDLFLF